MTYSSLIRPLLALLLGGASLTAEPASTWLAPTDPTVAPAVEQAKGAIKTLVGSLTPAVSAAVKEGGPPQGITLCHVQAEPLTRQALTAAGPDITGLKRTSLRVRNPANAPDPAEQAALDRVAALIASGQEPPPLLVQSVPASDEHPAEIRVYRSIPVAAGCVACHGDPETFSPELRTALHQRYPEDRATGYAEGDWRGLIRVSVVP